GREGGRLILTWRLCTAIVRPPAQRGAALRPDCKPHRSAGGLHPVRRAPAPPAALPIPLRRSRPFPSQLLHSLRAALAVPAMPTCVSCLQFTRLDRRRKRSADRGTMVRMPRGTPTQLPVPAARARRGYFECRYGQLHVHHAMPPGGGFEEGTP